MDIATQERIAQLKQESNELTKQGRIFEAINKFNEAWVLEFGDYKSIEINPVEFNIKRGFIKNIDEILLSEPDETGYWYVMFPDGRARYAEVEEANSSIKDVKFRVMLLDHSGESMDIRKEKAKWVKIHPQL